MCLIGHAKTWRIHILLDSVSQFLFDGEAMDVHMDTHIDTHKCIHTFVHLDVHMYIHLDVVHNGCPDGCYHAIQYGRPYGCNGMACQWHVVACHCMPCHATWMSAWTNPYSFDVSLFGPKSIRHTIQKHLRIGQPDRQKLI